MFASTAQTSAILTINGGSSSIKFAAFASKTIAVDQPISPLLGGVIDRIGQPGTALSAEINGRKINQPMPAADHRQAAAQLTDWLQKNLASAQIVGIGHRVVHGGLNLVDHQPITPAVLRELGRSKSLDQAHLPREIALIEAFERAWPGMLQVACFDTEFHRDLPPVARMLPIPRKYIDAGVRKFGFHGLSYTYLREALNRIEKSGAAKHRVIFAHLGSGASMAAVKDGRAVDTTMAFTPLAGLVMGTRPGDLDPGLVTFLMRSEKMDASEIDELLSRHCGLVGVSDTTSDMRDLQSRRGADPRAAQAIDLFCYSARKWIGALAATLNGLDTLVFSGGIGEHAAEIRAQICQGLDFLGLQLDSSQNENGAAVISLPQSSVTIRVIPTDEESVIAQITARFLKSNEKQS
jgi:acetate kinase